MQCDTMLVKCMPGPGNERGEVRINACDYNPEIHTTVEQYEASKKAAAEAALKQQVADTTSGSASGSPEVAAPAEAPKHETRIVEAEGRVEGKGGKKGK